MVEGHVPKGVEVQVLSSAPWTEEIPGRSGDFCFASLDPKGFLRIRNFEIQRKNL